MKRNNYSIMGLVLLLVFFLAFNLLNSSLFDRVRIDLTENGLYTLSEGSKAIVKDIEEPINLYFFFSQKVTKDLPQLRNYAERVRSLLEEYTAYAGGQINLHIIDPEPFSEAEELAAGYGLQAVPLSLGGDELYFGLAGTNAVDTQQVIPFFRPEQENFLEYEVSKLITTLVNPEAPVIGVISGLPIQGGYNMQTQQPRPPWQIYQQISQLYQTRMLNQEIESIDDDIDLLLMVQPKALSDKSLLAIDQYVLRGGKLILFVDPLAELAEPPPPMPYVPDEGLKKLLTSWGVNLPESVLMDAGNALTVAGAQGQPVRHLAILGLQQQVMVAEDIITTGLELVNLSTSGIVEQTKESTTVFEPILQSSANAMLMVPQLVQSARDPADLQKNFSPTGQVYSMAARISGKVNSAFAEKDNEEHIRQAENVHILVIADTDLLSDRLWVQVQSFFGQQVISPFADNASLVINALDNFTGSADLISVRSRGQFSRPFIVVENLRRAAEERFQDTEKQLQERLKETQQQLNELQQQNGEGNQLLLSPEQNQALQRFQDEKLVIRKQLRDVRHQLDKDIEQLGTLLKLVNIALIPLLVVIVVLMLKMFRRRSPKGI